MNTPMEWCPTADFFAKPENANQHDIDAKSSDRLIESDLSFFIDTGLGQLLKAMLRQSLIDIIEDRKNGRASAETSMSSRWPETDAGRSSIEFLMPSVSPDRVIASIYQDPDKVLDALNKGEKRFYEPGVRESDALPAIVKTLTINGEGSEPPAFDGSRGALSSDDLDDHYPAAPEAHSF